MGTMRENIQRDIEHNKYLASKRRQGETIREDAWKRERVRDAKALETPVDEFMGSAEPHMYEGDLND